MMPFPYWQKDSRVASAVCVHRLYPMLPPPVCLCLCGEATEELEEEKKRFTNYGIILGGQKHNPTDHHHHHHHHPQFAGWLSFRSGLFSNARACPCAFHRSMFCRWTHSKNNNNIVRTMIKLKMLLGQCTGHMTINTSTHRYACQDDDALRNA